jgi:hypothetical protein
MPSTKRRDQPEPAGAKITEPGSTVGNRGEPSAETIPDLQPDAERLSAYETDSSGEGKAEERVQGRDDEWPHGHRSGGVPPRKGVEQPR